MAPTRKSRWHSLWREWILPFLVVLIVLGSFRSAVADWLHVPTGSMLPTIVEGDRIFVNKLAYDLKVPFLGTRMSTWSDPVAGEVVVFWSPEDRKRLVKRVIGAPGDRVELRNNQLYRNGEPAEYLPLDPEVVDLIPGDKQSSYQFRDEKVGKGTHPIMTALPWTRASNFGPITVPEGTYFMMGDNRDNSRDSRWFGFVDRAAIIGRVVGVAFSLNPSEHYLPRWGRTMTPLP